MCFTDCEPTSYLLTYSNSIPTVTFNDLSSHINGEASQEEEEEAIRYGTVSYYYLRFSNEQSKPHALLLMTLMSKILRSTSSATPRRLGLRVTLRCLTLSALMLGFLYVLLLVLQFLKSNESTIASTTTTATTVTTPRHEQSMARISSNPPQQTQPPAHINNVRSTRTALSRGVDRYTTVCLRARRPNRHLQFRIYGVQNVTQLHATMMLQVPSVRPNYFEWSLTQQAAYPASQWEADLVAAAATTTRHVRHPTLLTVDIFDNPGHCLADLIWSLAVDRYERPNTTRLYPYFVFGHRDDLMDPQLLQGDYHNNWCWNFLQATGWLGTQVLLPRDSSNKNNSQNMHNQMVCFDELLVPSWSLFRFPLQSNTQVASLRRYTFLWRHMRTHDFDATYNWAVPVAALQAIQTAVMASLNLSMEPWPTAQQSVPLPILVLDRQGHQRRQWINSINVMDALQARYPDISVRVVHETEWQTMTFRQQATLFHQHGTIIAVHAGALANLIFCRPGTRIVELACLNPGEPQANSRITTRPPTTSSSNKDDDDDDKNDAWQGPTGWYNAFTRPLNMQHYILSDTLDCTGGAPGARRHDAAEIVAAIPETVQFLATRLGLY